MGNHGDSCDTRASPALGGTPPRGPSVLMPASYITRLVDTSEARPSSIAMRIVGDDSEAYTFGESLTAIRSIASRLRSNYIDKGDRVALIGENHPCWAL